MKNIEFMDIYGTHSFLNMEGKPKYKSVVGIICSIFTLTLIAVTMFFFGRDFFEKTNPLIIYEHVNPPKHRLYDIRNSNFFFAFRISDEVGQPAPPGALLEFYPFVSRLSRGDKGELEIKEHQAIEIKKCDKVEKLNEKFKESFDPSSWYCFENHLLQNLGGDWTANFLNYFGLIIYTCDPSAKNLGCEQEKLMNYLNVPKVLVTLSPNYFFSPSNLLQPLDYELKSNYRILNANLLTVQNYYYKYALLSDDRGWVFQDVIDNGLFTLDDIETDIQIFSKRNNKIKTDRRIYYLLGYMTKNYDHYKRSFMKIQMLAAVVGGFMRIVTAFFSIIVYYFNEHGKINKLLNIFYDKKPKHLSMQSLRYNNYIENKSYSKITLNEVDKRNKYKTPKRLRTYSVLNYLRIHACCLFSRRKKNIIEYKKLVSTIKSRLDIIHLVKLSLDVQRLRALLLTDIQNKAFDFIKNEDLLANKSENYREEVTNYYQNLFQENNFKDKTDKYIFENMGYEILADICKV